MRWELTLLLLILLWVVMGKLAVLLLNWLWPE